MHVQVNITNYDKDSSLLSIPSAACMLNLEEKILIQDC